MTGERLQWTAQPEFSYPALSLTMPDHCRRSEARRFLHERVPVEIRGGSMRPPGRVGVRKGGSAAAIPFLRSTQTGCTDCQHVTRPSSPWLANLDADFSSVTPSDGSTLCRCVRQLWSAKAAAY